MEWHRAHAANPRLAVTGAVICSLLVIFPIVAGGWFVGSVYRGLPDSAAVGRIGEMAQATAVYDNQDRLAFSLYKEQRIDAPLGAVSPRLVDAILAIEDRRFYKHSGFDPIRIAGAALANLRAGRVAQGASTITQQFARQSFLTSERTLRRKVQEVLLARRIERAYSKAEILELYLNKVYFGDGLYGVEAAARGFFGVHASELSVVQAATLAGLVKSPSTYAPTVNPDRAVARRDVVLAAMRDTGAIDALEYETALQTPLALTDALRPSEPYGQYFKEEVRRELVERFGTDRVYQGGLQVYSTIDVAMQKAADLAVADGLDAVDARRARLKLDVAPGGAPLQAAAIALDPATGAVRALVGGRDFAESSFNRANQAHRQPGSAFKPFVYAAALEAGYTPATMISNLDAPIETLQGNWTPEDAHDDEAARMSLRYALRTSSNRAAVRLLQDVGIPSAVRYAKAMGVGDVPSVPSLALGSGEVTLESMTAAFAAFANHGIVSTPFLIRRVEDMDGTVLYEHEVESAAAVSDATAYLMTSLLADVIDRGTGAGARRTGFALPAAGKTGTTNDFKDAWFVGFTPRLAAGVWVGFDEPRMILPGGFASEVAVPIWGAFMKTATKGDRAQWFDMPSGVTTARVCPLSGRLATADCEHAYVEYFARGTEPADVCDIHKPSRGLLEVVASLFTTSPRRPPEPAQVAVVVPSPVPPPASEPAPAPTDEQPKKRGFWSRVIRLGR